jgi:hypothetical protein
MSIVDLEALFRSLPVPDVHPSDGLRFTAVPVSPGSKHRIGRGKNGEPALLLAADSSGDAGKRPPRIELEHISVQHDVICRVSHPNSEWADALFTVVQYSGGDSVLRSYFMRMAGALLLSLDDTPAPTAVQEAVRRLVELFRVLVQPQRKSVQGIWAELFLIAQATHPETLAAAWHIDPEDRYDFNAGHQRIEVKSASGRSRRHRFSLEQLIPPSDTMLLIASVLMENSAGGVTLGQLLDRVQSRLRTSSELGARVEHVVARTLGEALPRALNFRFDYELAQDSLRFFAYEEIPTIPCPVGPAITEVSFVADLTAVSPINLPPDEALFTAVRKAG